MKKLYKEREISRKDFWQEVFNAFLLFGTLGVGIILGWMMSIQAPK